MSENAPFYVDESRREPFRVQVTSRMSGDDRTGWALFQFFCRDYAEAKAILEQLAADGWIVPPGPVPASEPVERAADPVAPTQPLAEVAGGGGGAHLLGRVDAQPLGLGAHVLELSARPLSLRSRLLEFLFGRSKATAQPHGPEEQRH